jgi:hypothetical protein
MLGAVGTLLKGKLRNVRWECWCPQIFFDRSVDPFSCFIDSVDHYTAGKIVGQVSDVLWN